MLVYFGAAAMTVVVETLVLYGLGYRTRTFVAVCALINLITNLTLNIGLLFSGLWYQWLLYPAEILVVIVEWAVLRLVIDRDSPHASIRLFAAVCLANFITYMIGFFLF